MSLRWRSSVHKRKSTLGAFIPWLMVLVVLSLMALSCTPHKGQVDIYNKELPQFYIGTTNAVVKGPTLLTFHGVANDTSTAGQQPIIVHVLIKAKRQVNGSYFVRTVTYVERVVLLSDDAFAPVPNRLSLFFEYQQDARQPWLPLRLTSLGVIQPEGPYVHQVEVLESIATKELRMRLLDWPIYYTVDLQKIATSNQYGRMAKSRGAFRNAIVISGLHELESNMIVKLLASHMSHHIPMGFDVYLLYARGSDLLKAILANDVTSSFVDNGSLQVVLLDSLQLPAYDDRRTNTAHPFHISYDAMKLIAYNHAALMLWGERFRLAVMDLDEFWSPHPSHSLVNSWFDTCYAGADVLMSERVDVVCNRTAPRYSVTEMNYFQSHWNASGPTDVLKRFSKVASFSQDPKSIFWPDKVGQVWLHKPESLPGSKVTKVTINNGRIHEPNCVFIVHLYNLFKTRIPEDSITLFDLKW